MARTELERMLAGDWYTCIDDELEGLRHAARAAVHEHNTLDPERRGAIAPALRELLGDVGTGVFVEAPFPLRLRLQHPLRGRRVPERRLHRLDTAPVVVGAGSMLGPGVHIYCAQHHRDVEKRAAGLEIADPVEIGETCGSGAGRSCCRASSSAGVPSWARAASWSATSRRVSSSPGTPHVSWPRGLTGRAETADAGIGRESPEPAHETQPGAPGEVRGIVRRSGHGDPSGSAQGPSPAGGRRGEAHAAAGGGAEARGLGVAGLGPDLVHRQGGRLEHLLGLLHPQSRPPHRSAAQARCGQPETPLPCVAFVLTSVAAAVHVVGQRLACRGCLSLGAGFPRRVS